jgi:hypothetical protein
LGLAFRRATLRGHGFLQLFHPLDEHAQYSVMGQHTLLDALEFLAKLRQLGFLSSSLSGALNPWQVAGHH